MITIKAFIIVALVFGVFTMGPIIVTIIGLGLAIWIVRALLIAEKESKENGTKENNAFTGFAGGEHFSPRRKSED